MPAPKKFKKNLEIFSTNRAIRSAERQNESFLDDQISIGDFFASFTRRNRPLASDAQRSVFMYKASAAAAKKLKMQPDFFNFLRDKEYLFSFFEELAAQGVSIEQLKSSDRESFFDEYLITLEEVLKNYLEFLENANLSDAISCAKLEKNEYLLGQYEQITLHLDGFLKRAEVEFLASIKNLKILADLSVYNAALMKKSFGCEFEPGFCYEICAAPAAPDTDTAAPAAPAAAPAPDTAERSSWVARKLNALPKPKKLRTAGFKSAMLQYLFALYECARQVREGEFEPEQIALILCDESKASALQALDVRNYCNIAKGLKDLGFEQKLAALSSSCAYELARENVLASKQNLAALGELCEELLAELASDGQAKEQLALQLAELAELSEYENISFKQKLSLLKPLVCAHANGGAISALGALESRGARPASVVVVDFCDDYIPARASAQMYLNNALRKRAGLISHEERENLQRHYYELLFARAQRVVVLYVANEQQRPARFLKRFICEEIAYDERALLAGFDALVHGEAGGEAGGESAPETAAATPTPSENPLFLQKLPTPSENPLFSQNHLKIPTPSENPLFLQNHLKIPAPSENPVFSQNRARLDATPLAGWDDARIKQLVAEHDFCAKELSFSRLSCLQTSGAEYFFKYILRLDEPRALEPDAAQKGQRVHALLETAPLTSPQDFLAHFAAELAECDALNAAILRKNLARCYEFLSAFKGQSFCELNVRAKLGSVGIYGQIDRLIADGLDEKFCIIDYKNSANLNSASHAQQLVFYALILQNLCAAEQKSPATADRSQPAGSTAATAATTSAQATPAENIALPDLPNYELFNIYLKSPTSCVISRRIEAKTAEKLLSAIAEFAEDFRAAAWRAERARGYYHLLANKELS